SANSAPRTKVVNAATECRLGRHPEASSQDDCLPSILDDDTSGPGASPYHPSSIGSNELDTPGSSKLFPSHSDVKDLSLGTPGLSKLRPSCYDVQDLYFGTP
ncbi:hypothetical protein MKW92_018715, partial [Papaver armeniacum]